MGRRWTSWLSLLGVVLALLGFGVHEVQAALTGVAIFPSPAPVNTPVTVVLQGSGVSCVNATVNFGDGGPDLNNINRSLPFTVTHTYRRPGTFTVVVGCGRTINTPLTVGPPSGLPFSLRRIELRWENGRGDFTVPKDAADLTAYADILFNGSGQLIAQWEVDGRILAVVHEYLTFGSRTTIRTPRVPPLPTFEAGLHRLTLRVTQPTVNFVIPVITYFVTAAPPVPPRLELVAPGPGATVLETPLAFQWKPLSGGAAAYRVDLFEERATVALASALTREASYTLPAATTRRLAAGGRYAWRVTALNEAGGALAESEARVFLLGATPAGAQIEPRQVLVGLRRATLAVIDPIVADLETRHGLRRLDVVDLQSIDTTLVLFETAAGASVPAVVGALATDPRVQLVQPNVVFVTGAGDPLANLQYAPPMIGVPATHARVTGKSVRVAVIDSAVATDHPDLAGRIVARMDFTGAEPAAEAHGTLVAGLIAAVTGNGIGIAGVAPGAELLALRACRSAAPAQVEARCTAFAVGRALDFALLNGARVVNLSLGGPRDQLVARLVERAEALGVAVVAAVGNLGPGAPPLYPAALEHVIAVTAVDAKNRLYPMAIQGDFVRVSAPGVEVLSTAPGGRYTVHTGTSLAAAHVSGVAALLLEAKPDLTPKALRELLAETAQPPTGGRNRHVGHGLVNACRAVERALGGSLACPPR